MQFRTQKVNTGKVQHFNNLPNAQQAGMLSNDEHFRTFAGTSFLGSNIQVSPTATAEFIRTYCGVASRRDLNTNDEAARKFHALRTEFDAWAGRIHAPR